MNEENKDCLNIVIEIFQYCLSQTVEACGISIDLNASTEMRGISSDLTLYFMGGGTKMPRLEKFQ